MTVIIKMVSRDDTVMEDYDYRDAMEIYIGDKRVFRVSDGEPEDSNLSRDFSDCYSVQGLMKQCYELGKSGVEVMFTSEESDEV